MDSSRRRPITAYALVAALAVMIGFTPHGATGQDIATIDLAAARQAEADLIARLLEAKTGPMAKVGVALAELHAQHEVFQAERPLRLAQPPLEPADPMIRVRDGYVTIEAVAADDTETLLRELEALGLQGGAAFGPMVSGRLPIAALDDMAALDALRQARPAMAITRAGSVTSQGDAALDADFAREEEEVRGRRVTVGVLSDSYDCLDGAADDIASGDLPRESRISILDDSACPDGGDEGRAMMQLIRDVAPGARQAFHTAFNGQPDFAGGIVELAEVAGADVIVDDVIYLAEPMFQDGIVAQAVDDVKAAGVAYFSSSGNNGRNSWESDEGFNNSLIGGVTGLRHDFDSGPGVDVFQTVRIGTGDTFFSFQWDEPFASASVGGEPGSASDLDIFLFFQGIFLGIGSAERNIISGDPVEVFGVRNSGPPIDLQIGIELVAGPPPELMKYVIFDPPVETIGDPPTSFVVEYATNSSSNYGHANAAGAAGVGAAFWRRTPRFGVFPPEIENFSSAGGTPILFDLEGRRIPPDIRAQPRFTGPDGGITTFFGNRDSFGRREPGGNHFFGTSAAAPHVAAVAALMLEANRQLSPDDIFEILEDTAIDMDDPVTPDFDLGFDFGTGFGLVDALEAVEEAEDFEDDDEDDD